MKQLKLACAGGWHSHAKDFPHRISQKGGDDHLSYQYVGIWDDDPERGRQWAKELDVPFFENYEDLLAIPKLDGVLVTSGTTKHAELIIRACEAGIHVFVEKLLTVVPEEAYAIQKAVKENGIHFTMSDPMKTPDLVYIKKMADAGAFGELTCVRSRQCHGYGLSDPELMGPFYQKEEAGGGAAIDMGCHAAHVIEWFLGRPTGVTGIFNRYTAMGKRNDVDDNTVMLFDFASGAVGIAETGWVCPGQKAFDLYGTRGMAHSDSEGLRYKLGDADWVYVKQKELPEGPTYPLIYWAESLTDDFENTEYTIDEAVMLTEMLAAAYRSDGKQIPIRYKTEDRRGIWQEQ